MAGDRSGYRPSNPNSSEGGRPEDGQGFSKDHLQQRWKGNHISELVRWEVLASAEDVDRCVGVEETAGATETEHVTATNRWCGSQGEGTAGDTSCNRLSDPNPLGGGKPTLAMRRTQEQRQPRVMGNHMDMLVWTGCRGLREEVEAQIGAEGDGTTVYRMDMDEPALNTNPGCDGDWAREDGKVGDMAGSRMFDLNSNEGGRPTGSLGSAKGQQQPWGWWAQTEGQSSRRVPRGIVEAQPNAEKSDTGVNWDALSALVGPETDTNPGCGDVWALEHDKVGDMTGNSLSNLNSHEGGRPGGVLRSSKDQLQMWRKGNHISGLEAVEAHISTDDVDRWSGAVEVAGATETNPGWGGDGAQGGGKAVDTSGDRLSDLNSVEGGRPADVLRRAKGKQQPGGEQKKVLSEPEGALISVEGVDSNGGWGFFAWPATGGNLGCGGFWALDRDKVGDMAGNRLSDLNSDEGGRPVVVRRYSNTQHRWQGMGIHRVVQSWQVVPRGGMKAQRHTEEAYPRVGSVVITGPDAGSCSGSTGAGAQVFGMAGDMSGNRLSDLNSQEGGRPAEVLRKAMDHLQLRTMGNHISVLESTDKSVLKKVGAQTNAEEEECRVGKRETLGTTLGQTMGAAQVAGAEEKGGEEHSGLARGGGSAGGRRLTREAQKGSGARGQ